MSDSRATPSVCVSVDLDSLRCYAAIHGLNDAPLGVDDPIFSVAMGRMLRLFASCGVRATLFCIGEDTELDGVRAILAESAAEGHELGNHTWFHRYDLRSRDKAVIAEDIARGAEAIASVCGEGPVGFRTPGYNVDPVIASVLADQGYRYDSSLFPCPPYYAAKGLVMASMALRGRRSNAQMVLPWTQAGPIRPYRASIARPWRRASGDEPSIWEVPMCLVPGARFPLIGTSLHLVGARGFKALMPLLSATYRRMLQLEFHAIDFLDASDPGVPGALVAVQPDLKVRWEDKARLYRQIFETISKQYRFRTMAEGVELL